MDGDLMTSVHPKKLVSDAQTHESFVFGAVAELIDNSKDEGATELRIEYDEQRKILSYTDNGNGMSWEKCRQMMCHGNSSKGEKDIGKFGVGFKSGSMRQARDALVLTSDGRELVAALLSQTYLERTGATSIRVPMLSWDCGFRPTRPQSNNEFADYALTIQEFIPGQSLKELIAEVKKIPPFEDYKWRGTRILLFNLKDGKRDLSMESADLVIQRRFDGRPFMKPRPGTKNQMDVPIDYSLRAYAAVLYRPVPGIRSQEEGTPPMRIVIQGRAVAPREPTEGLQRPWTAEFEVELRGGPEKVAVTYGFSREDFDRGACGHHVYCNGRLVTSYWQLGVMRATGNQCLGVVGVLDCPFLRVLNCKQGFHNDSEELYDQVEANLTRLVDKYYEDHIEGQEPLVKSSKDSQRYAASLMPGEVCWAKFLTYWWPASVLRKEDLTKKQRALQRTTDQVPIQWFAEEKSQNFAWVMGKDVLHFRGRSNPNKPNAIPKDQLKKFQEAERLAKKEGDEIDRNPDDNQLVQCRECMKWRYLSLDICGVGDEDWYCYQNPDERFNKCNIPMPDYIEDFLKQEREEKEAKAAAKAMVEKKTNAAADLDRFISLARSNSTESAELEKVLGALENISIDSEDMSEAVTRHLVVLKEVINHQIKFAYPSFQERLDGLWKRWKVELRGLRARLRVSIWAVSDPKREGKSRLKTSLDPEDNSVPKSFQWHKEYESDAEYRKHGSKPSLRTRLIELAKQDYKSAKREAKAKKQKEEGTPRERAGVTVVYSMMPAAEEGGRPRVAKAEPTRDTLYFQRFSADEKYVEDGNMANFMARCKWKIKTSQTYKDIVEGKAEVVNYNLHLYKRHKLGGSNRFEGRFFNHQNGKEVVPERVCVQLMAKGSGCLVDEEGKKVLLALKGPKLCRYLRFEEDQNFQYILTEFCGRSLDKSNSIPEKKEHRLGIFRQTLEAVKYLHQNELVHGNLKPSSIFVDLSSSGSSPLVKLTGFCFGYLSGGMATDSEWWNSFAADFASLRQILVYLLDDKLRHTSDFESRKFTGAEVLALAPGGRELERRAEVEATHFLRATRSAAPGALPVFRENQMVHLERHPLLLTLEQRHQLLECVCRTAMEGTDALVTHLDHLFDSIGLKEKAQRLHKKGFLKGCSDGDVKNPWELFKFLCNQWKMNRHKDGFLFGIDLFPCLFLAIFCCINCHMGPDNADLYHDNFNPFDCFKPQLWSSSSTTELCSGLSAHLEWFAQRKAKARRHPCLPHGQHPLGAPPPGLPLPPGPPTEPLGLGGPGTAPPGVVAGPGAGILTREQALEWINSKRRKQELKAQIGALKAQIGARQGASAESPRVDQQQAPGEQTSSEKERPAVPPAAAEESGSFTIPRKKNRASGADAAGVACEEGEVDNQDLHGGGADEGIRRQHSVSPSHSSSQRSSLPRGSSREIQGDGGDGRRRRKRQRSSSSSHDRCHDHYDNRSRHSRKYDARLSGKDYSSSSRQDRHLTGRGDHNDNDSLYARQKRKRSASPSPHGHRGYGGGYHRGGDYEPCHHDRDYPGRSSRGGRHNSRHGNHGSGGWGSEHPSRGGGGRSSRILDDMY